MRKTFLLLSFITGICFSQTPSKNYIVTTSYPFPYTGGETTFSSIFTSQQLLVDPSIEQGIDEFGNLIGAGGNISYSDASLSINFAAGWVATNSFKLGVIQNFSFSPPLPDIEVGDILQNGLPTGFKVKIYDNKMIVYSRHYLNRVNTDLVITNVQGISGDVNLSIANWLNCVFGSPNTVLQQASFSVAGSTVSLTINWNGGQGGVCTINTQNPIDLGIIIPDMELGVITVPHGIQSAYHAKIENNKLIFYCNDPIPDLPTGGQLNFNHNFSDSQDFKKEVVKYFDGLGRPLQEIAKKQSGSGKNIITHFEYDDFGRQARHYLPYKSDNTGLNYEPQAANQQLNYYLNPTFQNNGDSNFEPTSNPYIERSFELSAESRVTAEAAPGNDWAMTGGHTTKIFRESNSFQEVRKFKVDFPDSSNKNNHILMADGFFNPGQLLKSRVKDENWTVDSGHDHTIQEFKDKLGRLVLRRTFNNNLAHDTYYVYDLFGNLSYVIPPKASESINLEILPNAQISRNFPWTRIVEVDRTLAEEYERLFLEYNNELIRDADLLDRYGGQGGFTLNSDGQEMSLVLDLSTTRLMNLRRGEIASLDEFGRFKDVELGRYSSPDAEYIFFIRDNKLMVEGGGQTSAMNLTLTANSKLIYTHNYPWPSLLEIDERTAEPYVRAFAEMPNQDVLTTYIENPFGAIGGLNITVDENDSVSINLDVSANIPVKFKNGTLVPLRIERRIENRDLGEIAGVGYSYRFSIIDNSLLIEGDGEFQNANRTSSSGSSATLNAQIPLEIIQGLCYEYRYDSRNRLVEKRIPGKGWEFMVYDRLDRIALVQDGKQRSNNKWFFTKYDNSGRAVITGETVIPTSVFDSANRIFIQDQLNAETILNISRSSSGFTHAGLSINYSNEVFPIIGLQSDLYTVQYYDDYDTFATEIPTQVFGNQISANTKFLETVTHVKVLGSNHWVTHLMGYDSKARLIWAKKSNSFLNSVTTQSSKLDFSGKVMETNSVQQKSGSPDVTIADRFTYDHGDRLLRHTQQISGEQAELICFNRYDELGKLVQKKVGGAADLNLDFVSTVSLQTVNYSYNVRGWLTHINDPLGVLSTNQLFALKLSYNTTTSGQPQYNGNIAETHWKSHFDSKLRSYNYSYDALSRLNAAEYVGNHVTPYGIEGYNEDDIQYDMNGNITFLSRYGLTDAGVMDQIDKLDYQYVEKSNRLQSISDEADTAGFKDGSQATDNNVDYDYDANGNMVSDRNKDILSISYNSLNLPVTIVFNSGNPVNTNKIEYVYDASGTKIEQKVTQSLPNGTGGWHAPSVTVTQYDQLFLYKDNVMQSFWHPEGYVTKEGEIYNYVYQYKDHLGNVRMSYTGTPGNLQIADENHYYPLGLKHQGYDVITNVGNPITQKFKFNGKEYQEELGLNWYDYHARNYDPAIGRFMNIDPLAENSRPWSPFAYCYNNPVIFTDPDGMQAEDWRINFTDTNGKSQTFMFNGKNASDAPKNEFVLAFISAYNYNVGNGGGESLRAIAENKNIISDVYESNNYSYSENGAINWNPKMGLEGDNGVVMSPATVMEHEGDHVLQRATRPNTQKKDIAKSDADYNNKEEKRVITGSEQKTARANGEIKSNNVTRTNHQGLPVVTTSPTSNIVNKKATYQFHEKRKYTNETFSIDHRKYKP